ncbi:MAG TPA: MFS transporter, partial [Acidimicrobiales bacterium]|nr:MFS transporter [Acidimicrobiales bacterium]
MQAVGERRRAAAAGVAAVGAALAVCAWGGNQFTPLLVLYRSADHWGATTVDALLGAYVVGLVPALLVGGRVSDRFGRRRPVLVALVASAAGSSLLASGALPAVALGRLCSGVGVGLAMAVGTTWATELAVASGRSRPAGARRASLSLTAGFGLGAGVAGTLAQWGPAPETTPYLVHVALDLAVLAWVAATGRDAPAPAATGPAGAR